MSTRVDPRRMERLYRAWSETGPGHLPQRQHQHAELGACLSLFTVLLTAQLSWEAIGAWSLLSVVPGLFLGSRLRSVLDERDRHRRQRLAESIARAWAVPASLEVRFEGDALTLRRGARRLRVRLHEARERTHRVLAFLESTGYLAHTPDDVPEWGLTGLIRLDEGGHVLVWGRARRELDAPLVPSEVYQHLYRIFSDSGFIHPEDPDPVPAMLTQPRPTSTQETP